MRQAIMSAALGMRRYGPLAMLADPAAALGAHRRCRPTLPRRRHRMRDCDPPLAQVKHAAERRTRAATLLRAAACGMSARELALALGEGESKARVNAARLLLQEMERAGMAREDPKVIRRREAGGRRERVWRALGPDETAVVAEPDAAEAALLWCLARARGQFVDGPEAIAAAGLPLALGYSRLRALAARGAIEVRTGFPAAYRLAGEQPPTAAAAAA